jgi:hypothetical protein
LEVSSISTKAVYELRTWSLKLSVLLIDTVDSRLSLAAAVNNIKLSKR